MRMPQGWVTVSIRIRSQGGFVLCARVEFDLHGIVNVIYGRVPGAAQHDWSRLAEGTNASRRGELFVYAKAFCILR